MSVRDYIKKLAFKFNIHPRNWMDAINTYPRFMGMIKPKLLTDSDAEFIARRLSMQKGWWCKKISAPIGKRILSIAAHPDDEVMGTGGLLLAHRNLAEMHFLTICNGEEGCSAENCPPGQDMASFKRDLAVRRKKELQKTAQMLGVVTNECLDFPDGKIPITEESTHRVREIVYKIKPDVILLPWFLDDHHDHRMTNILFASACQDYECMIFACEVWSLLQPNAVLDITENLENKLNLLRNYQSQLSGIGYISYVQGLARVRAFQNPVRDDLAGAVEAYMTLPSREYCSIVRNYYGYLNALKKPGLDLLKG